MSLPFGSRGRFESKSIDRGHLNAARCRPAMFDEFGHQRIVDSDRRVGLDDSLDLFAVLGVRDAENGDVDHRGVGEEYVFDLLGVDVDRRRR